MTPFALFALAATVAVGFIVLSVKRDARRAREIFSVVAPTIRGRVTSPRIGIPSLRFNTCDGEAKMSLRGKGFEVRSDHLRLRMPCGAGADEVTRVRTRPTIIVHTKGEVITDDGLPERWHLQSTHPAMCRQMLADEAVRRSLRQVQEHRQVAVEIRSQRLTIEWGEPLSADSAHQLLELGRAIHSAVGSLVD